MLGNLPPELIRMILRQLNRVDLIRLRAVNRSLRNFINENGTLRQMNIAARRRLTLRSPANRRRTWANKPPKRQRRMNNIN